MEESYNALIEGTNPALAWWDRGKPQETSVRISDLRAEILT
jgi:hypothetical protein